VRCDKQGGHEECVHGSGLEMEAHSGAGAKGNGGTNVALQWELSPRAAAIKHNCSGDSCYHAPSWSRRTALGPRGHDA